MLEIHERLTGCADPQVKLTLPFELRQKSRLRAVLDSGDEVGLFLPRGSVLRQGDLLQTTTGLVVQVVAALESVSTATSADPLLLARACYHLGNRHIVLQIGAGWLRYLHDHVLDHMVRELGIIVVCEQAAFEPEAGAYDHHHGAGHSHDH